MIRQHNRNSKMVLRVQESETIMISADTLKVSLIRYTENVQASKFDFGTVGIFITLLVTVCTVDFKPVFGLPSQVWHALCIFGTILCGAYTAKSIFIWWRSKGKRQTPEQFVDQLMERAEKKKITSLGYTDI